MRWRISSLGFDEVGGRASRVKRGGASTNVGESIIGDIAMGEEDEGWY